MLLPGDSGIIPGMENLPAPPPELFVQLGVLDAEKLKR